MNSINPKKPFKYSHIDRRIDSNYVVIKENYYDHSYEYIPKLVCYMLLQHLPLEIIGIIWNIKTIREDTDFCDYIKLLKPDMFKLNSGITLRNTKLLHMNTTHFGVFINSFNSIIFRKINYGYDTLYSNYTSNIINDLHKCFITWYEYLQTNILEPDIKRQLQIIELKITDFYYSFATHYPQKRNMLWYNSKQRDRLFLKIKDCMYYIHNFSCILYTSTRGVFDNYDQTQYCYKCRDFDIYVNSDIYSKDKSFFEYFPNYKRDWNSTY